MAIANANPDHTRRLVEDKNYDNEATSTIKALIETTWKSALNDAEGNSVPGSTMIKGKCIGVLDVTMEESDSRKTHLYVIACSSTGLQDSVAQETAKFERIWNKPGGCKERIDAAISAYDKAIVAPVGPSTQCYCSVPPTTTVLEFSDVQQKAYWKELEIRIKNRQVVLKRIFQIPLTGNCKLNDDQLKEVESLLRESVYGAKFKVDKLSEDDFKILVNWHKDYFEKSLEDIIASTIAVAEKSPEKAMLDFCVANKAFFLGYGYSPEQIMKLCNAATDPCPRNMQELPMRVEILGLRYLDDQMNAELRKSGQYNKSTKDVILQGCDYLCRKPNHSRIADYFAQCAEDNATIALMKYLENAPSKKVTSVDWYSTGLSESGSITHKHLCGVCDIRFKDRLEWLLEHRDKKETDTNEPHFPDTNEHQFPDTQYYHQIFIKNAWCDSVNEATFPIINPDTRDHICDVAKGNAEDVKKAVVAAQQAFQPGSLWRTMGASDRSRLLYKLADLIERDRIYLTRLEYIGNGGPSPGKYLSEVIKCYQYFAWWASKLHGKTLPEHGPYLCFTSREPVGIVGQIISGDFPLLMQAWTLGPALCAGNTVVLNPAEQTPLTALHIASLIKEAGFPPGVVNIVPGDGSTGAAVANHPDINKVVFMGSTEVGHRVVQEDGVNSQKVTRCYELGFKGPTVVFVFADADLDDAVEKSYFAPHLIFYKDQPPPCTFVEESIYNTFVWKYFERAKRYKPNVEDTTLIAKICSYVITFDDISTVIAIARITKYGIATIYTADGETAKKMAINLCAGTICINCFDAFNAQAPHSTRLTLTGIA